MPERQVVMVRYGELFLKSGPVMRQFIQALLRNAGRALDSSGLEHRFELHRGRLLIHGDDPEAIAAVACRIFGIVDVAVCMLTSTEPGDIAAAAVEMAHGRLAEGTRFAVRPRRQGVAGITSQELGSFVGAALCREYPASVVDLTCPEYEIFIELREFGGLLYDRHLPGPGGLPLGTQGSALTLLSAGIDSPVAAWMMMKRGCSVTSVHVDAGPFAGRDVLAGAMRNHAILSTWCAGTPLELLVADAAPFYDALTRRAPPRYRCVICKRFMFRVGSMLARSRSDRVLVTGESLGQVASQTLANLSVISGAASVPVLRPLIAFDKNDTVDLARKIGTFDPHPGDLACRAVPKLPATAAGESEILSAEAAIGIEDLVDRVTGNTRTLTAVNGKYTG